MNKIKPFFRTAHWILRAGIFFLFPPIFIFVAFPIGYLMTLPFGGSGLMTILIGYPISVCIVCAVAARVYNGTTFDIRSTNIIYNLDFLWSEKREILFVHIKEIELKIGFFQKFFGLGTIVLHILASTSGDGLSLFDIKNSGKIYQILKEEMTRASKAN